MSHDVLPIFVCVVLPVSIVLIVFLASMNSDNKRAKVLIKAIESNNNIDADKLAEAFKKPRKTAKEVRNLRLLRGCIFTLVGLVLIVSGVLTLIFSNYVFSSDSVSVPIIFGGISLAVGVSYLVVYYVSRKESTEETKA